MAPLHYGPSWGPAVATIEMSWLDGASTHWYNRWASANRRVETPTSHCALSLRILNLFDVGKNRYQNQPLPSPFPYLTSIGHYNPYLHNGDGLNWPMLAHSAEGPLGIGL